MKRLLLILFVILSCFSAVTNSYASEPLNKTFVNVFESEIYDSFLRQLETFLSEHPMETPDKLYTHLKNGPKGPSAQDKADFHRKIYLRLRDTLSYRYLIDPESELVRFLDDFTEWLFTGIDLHEISNQFVAKTTQLDPEMMLWTYQLSPDAFLIYLHDYICSIPKYGSEKESDNVGSEDNFADGDIPCRLYKLNNPKQTQLLRFSNVARDTLINPFSGKTLLAGLNEEFRNFIESYVSKGKKHLYINQMSRSKTESVKTEQIENMENDRNTKEGIFVVSLDRDSDSKFYMQTHSFERLNSAEEFKESFLKELFKPSGAYYWSKKLNQKEWKQRVKNILNEVHKRYYNNAPLLLREDRMSFIEIVYVEIVDALVDILEPDTMNISCKQTVDRGPSLYAFYYLYQKQKERELLPQDFVDLMYYVFTPPLAYHDRTTHIYRITRLQSAINRLGL